MTSSSLTPEQIQAQMQARLPYLAGLLHSETRLDGLELDSLDSMELLMLLDELYGIRLSLEEMQQISTVGELAGLIVARQSGRPSGPS